MTAKLPLVLEVKAVRDEFANTLRDASYRERLIRYRELQTLNWLIGELDEGRTLDHALAEIYEAQHEREFERHVQAEAEDRAIELLNIKGVNHAHACRST